MDFKWESAITEGCKALANVFQKFHVSVSLASVLHHFEAQEILGSSAGALDRGEDGCFVEDGVCSRFHRLGE